jgi:hypothetical protein
LLFCVILSPKITFPFLTITSFWSILVIFGGNFTDSFLNWLIVVSIFGFLVSSIYCFLIISSIFFCCAELIFTSFNTSTNSYTIIKSSFEIENGFEISLVFNNKSTKFTLLYIVFASLSGLAS